MGHSNRMFDYRSFCVPMVGRVFIAIPFHLRIYHESFYCNIYDASLIAPDEMIAALKVAGTYIGLADE